MVEGSPASEKLATSVVLPYSAPPASICSHTYDSAAASFTSGSLPVAVSVNGVLRGMVRSTPPLTVGGLLPVEVVVAHVPPVPAMKLTI